MGPSPRFTISFRSVGQKPLVKMPTGQFWPQAPQVVHSYTAFAKSSRSFRLASPGPKSLALRPSVDRMSSRNIRIFSGGETLRFPSRPGPGNV